VAVAGLGAELILEKIKDNIEDKVKAKLGNSLTALLADALLRKFGPKFTEMIQKLKNGEFPCARPCTCGQPGGGGNNSLEGSGSVEPFVREMDNYSAKLLEDFKKTMVNDVLPPIMRKSCTEKVKAAFPTEKILEVIKL
jgi:hypothetical protein